MAFVMNVPKPLFYAIAGAVVLIVAALAILSHMGIL